MGDAGLRTAARVGYTFRIDPREVLRASHFDRALLTAAHNTVQADLRPKPPPSRGG